MVPKQIKLSVKTGINATSLAVPFQFQYSSSSLICKCQLLSHCHSG